jgi:holo-[acyl-carrier protein] synthase
MPIRGLGIDVVDIARIDALLARHEDRFCERVFTAGEVAHSQGRRSLAQHLAARFAAKEAAMKALGTGLDQGVSWQDIEVVANASGEPKLVFRGGAAIRASTLGITAWHVSLTHSDTSAAAVVIAE